MDNNTTISFESMDLSSEILRAVQAMGFKEPSTVQAKTIPLMMEGQDINAIAPTGTGKTCAFGIPMLEYVQLKDSRVQEIVLAPTRELALQIGEELTKLAKFIDGVRIAVIYGGQSISRQITALKRKPQIVIATPGRLLDHMQRGNIRLDAVHTMVLDEADEMLNMGFVKDVTKIIEATPSDRQLVLFSATTNQDVLTIAWKYQHDPVEITIEATKADRPQITQYVIATEQDQKTDHLLYLLDADVYQRIMIFCNTKFMTDKLTSRLVKEGYNAQCLHGDIPQSKRNTVMNDFKRGKFPILVSTDVAARGIDVDDVEAVINYDLPNENEYYLHRIGRTGRAHKHGVSFSLVTFRESVRMDEILKYMLTAPTPLKFEDGVLCNEEGTPFFDHI
ncbi:DEAD/DEAH box helicase [Aristaeella lactis]|uniref:Superfamily II DNA and RNA helicase n=1 Tax=Aristaeella lactis TaxID=3046383 RepID=A0AC61PNN7_9FIRM|nr:DEAD/DEAH box helicase [Aristaeella lactis]QUA52600.1 DEAD/DEAH box helicase [Aristaeella lactis]SMC77750.1 Superfamily II DNA and RNA helicase [Aristaeella lactis]